jgi:hypothetical protein
MSDIPVLSDKQRMTSSKTLRVKSGRERRGRKRRWTSWQKKLRLTDSISIN